MKILITGTSCGIGKAVAQKFLACGHIVVGIDKKRASVSHKNYTHFVADITGELPDVDGVNILINNAGVQNSGSDVDVNLKATMRVTQKYAFHDGIKSVLFVASASARTGAEFAEYAASKGGVVAYMKNTALALSKYGATVNSISPGGVYTDSNSPVINNADKWERIMEQTPLKKWATVKEIAEFCYFFTVVNRSMTAQDILIDNGEAANSVFVW